MVFKDEKFILEIANKEEMVKREIDQEVHPEVLFYLNRIRYLQKSYKTAQTGFKQLVESYPDHPKAALASFHIARCIRGRYGIGIFSENRGGTRISMNIIRKQTFPASQDYQNPHNHQN